MTLKCLSFFIVLGYLPFTHATSIQLAKHYQNQPIHDFLVSEKLDGVRAIWQNNQLITRNGNIINAPKWFTHGWPDTWLDGELWSKREDFEFISSTVLDTVAVDRDWQGIRYFVFDMPQTNQPFYRRYQDYKNLVQLTRSPYLKYVEQHVFSSSAAFERYYQAIIINGGEGIMLHYKNALHEDGRSNHLLKLKPFHDTEAQVIGYTQGKGKYAGKVGALVVTLENGIEFKIGSGLTDTLRQDPPPIGSFITFRSNGLTKYGKPRFPRFLRVMHVQ